MNKRAFCKLLGMGSIGIAASVVSGITKRMHWSEVKNWIFIYKHNNDLVWGVTKGGEFYVDNYLETDPHIIAKKLVTDVVKFTKCATFSTYNWDIVFNHLVILNSRYDCVENSIISVRRDGAVWIKGKYIGNFEKHFRYV